MIIIAAGGTLECQIDVRLLTGCRMEADTPQGAGGESCQLSAIREIAAPRSISEQPVRKLNTGVDDDSPKTVFILFGYSVFPSFQLPVFYNKYSVN